MPLAFIPGCSTRKAPAVRDAKGTRRSRRRGVADHRRLVARPRATHIPACTLAPSPAGGGLRLGRKCLGRVPACMSIVFESTRPIFQRIRRIRRGLVLLKLFLYQPCTKKVLIVRNKSIRGLQPVAQNTNFDSFLVVKNVLCTSSCTPRKQRNTRMDLFRTKMCTAIDNGTKQTHTTQIPSWKNPLVVQCV